MCGFAPLHKSDTDHRFVVLQIITFEKGNQLILYSHYIMDPNQAAKLTSSFKGLTTRDIPAPIRTYPAPCKYYKSGTCKLGDQCRFSHGQKVCALQPPSSITSSYLVHSNSLYMLPRNTCALCARILTPSCVYYDVVVFFICTYIYGSYA